MNHNKLIVNRYYHLLKQQNFALENGFVTLKSMFGVFSLAVIVIFSLNSIAANNDGMEHGVIKAPGGLPIIWSKDIEPPVISILGANPLNIPERSIQTYVDAGATAIDNVDGNVNITATGSVNTQTPGAYQITYQATDSQGNIANAIRYVFITPDTIPPVITILGSSPAYITMGSIQTYDEGATAVDNLDGVVAITADSNVNTQVEGDYTVRYTAKDIRNNTAEATRQVEVREAQVAGPGTVFTRKAESWGMDRIDQRLLPLNGVTKFQNTGAGVRIYIVGSGIEKTLPDLGWESTFAFGPQVISDRFLPGWSPGHQLAGYSPIEGPYEDCVTRDRGHETTISQIIGGDKIGLVPAAKMVSVKTTTACTDRSTSGNLSKALQFVLDDAVPGQPTIMNFSRKVTDQQWLDTAALMKKIADRGILIVAAAGNDNNTNFMEGCERVASTIPSAIIVGASQELDITGLRTKAVAGSLDIVLNGRGPCVDIFAPGNFIPYFRADGVYVPELPKSGFSVGLQHDFISGSSYAAPHVTAAAAMILSANPQMSPAEVKRTIIQNSTKGVLGNMEDSADSRGRMSPNRLLYIGVEPPLDNPPVIPQFSYGERFLEKKFTPVYLPSSNLSSSLKYLGDDYRSVDIDLNEVNAENIVSTVQRLESADSEKGIYARQARLSVVIPGIDFRTRWGTQKVITTMSVQEGGMRVYHKKFQFAPTTTIFDSQGISRPGRGKAYRSASRLGPDNADYLLNADRPAYDPLSHGPRIRMFYENPTSSTSAAERELYPDVFWNYLLTTANFARDIQIKTKYVYSGRKDPNWKYAGITPQERRNLGIEVLGGNKWYPDELSRSNPKAFLLQSEKDAGKHNFGSKTHPAGERHIERRFVVPPGVKTMLVRSLPAKLLPKPTGSLNSCSYKNEVPTTLFVGFKRKLDGGLIDNFTGKLHQPAWECISVGSNRVNKKVNNSWQECTFHGGVTAGEWVVVSREPNDRGACFPNTEHMQQTIQVLMYSE